MILFFVLSDKLPYSIRILLESAIRNCDNFQVNQNDVEKIIDWENTSPKLAEIPFKPARVLLQVWYWNVTYDFFCLFLNAYFAYEWCYSLGLHWSSSCRRSCSYAWRDGQVGQWCQQDQSTGTYIISFIWNFPSVCSGHLKFSLKNILRLART